MPIFRFSSIVIFSVESLVFFLEYNQTVYLGLLKKKTEGKCYNVN